MKNNKHILLLICISSVQIFSINFEKDIVPQIKSRALAFGINEVVHNVSPSIAKTISSHPNLDPSIANIISSHPEIVEIGTRKIISMVVDKSLSDNLLASNLDPLFTQLLIDRPNDLKSFQTSVFEQCNNNSHSALTIGDRVENTVNKVIFDDIATPYAIDNLEQQGWSTSFAYTCTGVSKLGLSVLIASVIQGHPELKKHKALLSPNYSNDILKAGYYFIWPKVKK